MEGASGGSAPRRAGGGGGGGGAGAPSSSGPGAGEEELPPPPAGARATSAGGGAGPRQPPPARPGRPAPSPSAGGSGDGGEDDDRGGAAIATALRACEQDEKKAIRDDADADDAALLPRRLEPSQRPQAAEDRPAPAPVPPTAQGAAAAAQFSPASGPPIEPDGSFFRRRAGAGAGGGAETPVTSGGAEATTTNRQAPDDPRARERNGRRREGASSSLTPPSSSDAAGGGERRYLVLPGLSRVRSLLLGASSGPAEDGAAAAEAGGGGAAAARTDPRAAPRRGDGDGRGEPCEPPPRRQQPLRARGIPNYGQTCFLNSVLQSLASLPSLELHLHLLVEAGARRRRTGADRGGGWEDDGAYDDYDEGDPREAASGDPSRGMAGRVLDAVRAANGGSYHGRRRQRGRDPPAVADPLGILSEVARTNPQFAAPPSRSSPRAAPNSGEQQDAHELFQALLDAIVQENRRERPALGGGNADDGGARELGGSGCGTDGALTSAAALRARRAPARSKPDRRSWTASPGGPSRGATAATAEDDSGGASSRASEEEKKLEDWFEDNRLSDPPASSRTHAAAKGSDLPQDNEASRDDSGQDAGSLLLGDDSSLLWSSSSPWIRRAVAAAAANPALSPSPFSGWMGSILQCRECRHVRPIRNSLFVDVPVVPTRVSERLRQQQQYYRHGPSSHGRRYSPGASKARPADAYPSCTLERCLEEYTSLENVHDVECRSCTHRREAAALEDEAALLRGGVEALASRARKKSHGAAQRGGDPARALREELESVEDRLRALRATSPDDDGALEQVLAPTADGRDRLPEGDGGSGLPPAALPPLRLERGDAFKCLLLTRLPAVLCVHVQRRFYDPDTLRPSKTAQHVEFPEVLDVGPYCAYGGMGGGMGAGGVAGGGTAGGRASRIPYRLLSVIEHRGGAHSGHYVCYRRDPAAAAAAPGACRDGGGWVFVSDARVCRVGWDDVRRCQAYMLFYEAAL